MRGILLAGTLLAFASAAQAAPIAATVVGASSAYDAGTETFPASNAVDGRTGDTGTPGNWSFWLTGNGDINGYLILDLGGTYDLTSVTLEDTHNRGYFDRGTQGFTLSVGDTADATGLAVTGAFTREQWENLSDISVGLNATGRYLRFDATSSFGGSIGLNEISVFGTPVAATAGVPEPDTWASMMVGFVAIGAIGLRRRLSRAERISAAI